MRIHLLLLSLLTLIVRVSGEVTSNDTSDTTRTPHKKRSNVKKPNIIIILADDVGTGDIPFYWGDLPTSKVKMPHLQQLAEKGVTFTDAHSSSLCAPSRYMLLSGNYPHRGGQPYGTWSLDKDSNQFMTHQKSIAEVLQTEGYETAVFGKWHLGAKVPPNGMRSNKTHHITDENHDWTMPLIQGPADLGFNRSYISTGGIQSPPYSFFRDDYLTTEPSDANYWSVGNHIMPHGVSMILENSDGEGDPGWDSSAYDMILVNETSAFIDNHLENKPDDPFFAYVALGAVHYPNSPPDNYLDGTPVNNTYETQHLDMLGVMDKVVGSIVSIIESRNIAEETVIIFTSDNGGLPKSAHTGHLSGGPLRGIKGEVLEGGHRVPLIVRYDNIFPKRKQRNRMVGLNDIYSTICDLLSIDVPVGSAQDSVSFADYILHPKKSQGLRKFLGSFVLRSEGWSQAIRENSLKLSHHPSTNSFEAYNLKRDISESNNIVNDPVLEKKFSAMFDHLTAIGPCPDDRVGSFHVSLLGEDHECTWFKESKVLRCAEHIEGELYCHSICSRFKYDCRVNNMYGNIFELKEF